MDLCQATLPIEVHRYCIFWLRTGSAVLYFSSPHEQSDMISINTVKLDTAIFIQGCKF